MTKKAKAMRAYELAREIFQLEEVLRAKRLEFERLVGGKLGEQLSLPWRARESYPKRIRELLRAARPRAMAFHEIVAELGEEKSRETVRATLSKLVGANEVERSGPGLYRAIARAESDDGREAVGEE